MIESCRQILLDSLDHVLKNGARTVLTIADYGTADGGTSLPVMNALVARARGTDPEREIQVVYNDQPTNEWKSVFNHVLGVLPVPGSDRSYLQVFPTGVYMMAAGRSFFEQTVVSNLVHLGLASTCMHWLSALPGTLPGALHHAQVPHGSASLEPFKRQAAKDWEQVLLHRARELRPGGRMLIVNFVIDEDGQYLGRTSAVAKSMYDEKYKCWSAMAKEGRITQDELNRTCFQMYYRTLQEHRAPLLDKSSEAYRAGLRMISCETKITPCPYRASWLANPTGQAALDYARDFVLTTRTWSNSTYESALDDRRSPAERHALVDELFERYAQEVAKEPSAHGMDYVHAFLLLEKVDASSGKRD